MYIVHLSRYYVHIYLLLFTSLIWIWRKHSTTTHFVKIRGWGIHCVEYVVVEKDGEWWQV